MEHELDIPPIPVCIVDDQSAEKIEAATWGVWTSYTLAGTEPAQQIIPQDRRRRRAVVIVNGASPGVVYIGTQAQVQRQVGGILAGGNSVTLESQSPMWMAPDGTHPMTVSVLVEGYRANGKAEER